MAEAWRGFKKDGHWDVDVNVRNLSRPTTLPMMEMRASWKVLPKLQISFGADCRSCRRKSVSTTAFWIAKLRLYPV